MAKQLPEDEDQFVYLLAVLQGDVDKPTVLSRFH